MLGEVEGRERGEGFGADEGDVAGEDEEVLGGVRVEAFGEDAVVAGDLLEGVAGAELLLLEGPADAEGLDGGLDLGGFVADDADDLVGYGFGGGDDVEEQGLAADGVEDLGAAGLEACALAGGHDDDAEVFLHTGIMVSWREAGKGVDAKCAKFARSFAKRF